MGEARRLRWAMAAALVVYILANSCAVASDDRAMELLQRRSASKDGVIILDDASVRRFCASGRSYYLIIFFDALQLRERSELHLEELRAEFGLMAAAYAKNTAGQEGSSKVFFCTLEFKQSQSSFGLFGVSTLPNIRILHIGSDPPEKSEAMELSEFTRSAEGMSGFVESKTKFKVGPIDRPPLISKGQLFILVCGFLGSAPFVIKKLAFSKDSPLHNPTIWCIGAIAIYFFSVSGGMHNIIRKMPLFMNDKNNPGKLVFFYQGSGMQLGAEGFVVGYLYTLVGLILASITHFVVKLKSPTTQRITMLIGMVVCFWAVRKVILLDNWKTGYWVHAYVPKRWLTE